MVADADDGGVAATHRLVGMAKQGHDAARRAWAQAELTQGQMADVFRMEAVHVLARVDPVDQAVGVRDARQRQLDQDAVDLGIGVELVDQGQQFGLGGAGRQVVIEGFDAHFLGRTALVAHVHGRGRVATHQHHGQARTAATGSQAGIDPDLEAVQQVFGDAAAIENAGGRDGVGGR